MVFFVTSALGDLLQVRGSSGTKCYSVPVLSLLVRGPGVSLGWLVIRVFSLLLIDVLSVLSFSVVLLGFPFCWRPPTNGEHSSLFPFCLSSPVLLSLAVAVAPSVCLFR